MNLFQRVEAHSRALMLQSSVNNPGGVARRNLASTWRIAGSISVNNRVGEDHRFIPYSPACAFCDQTEYYSRRWEVWVTLCRMMPSRGGCTAVRGDVGPY